MTPPPVQIADCRLQIAGLSIAECRSHCRFDNLQSVDLQSVNQQTVDLQSAICNLH